jgi:hypothetical protein
MLSTNVLRYGSEAALPAPRALRAGPLQLVYLAGDLRYIRLGGREVLRRVYVAVRDQNWGTIPAQLSNERVEADERSFRIQYDAAHQRGEIDFAWRGEISGAEDGTISFSMDGAARSTFLSNRVGFCVLHPASCAGARCRVEHVDGSSEGAAFPWLIAPQRFEGGHNHPVYPFAEMRALAHELEPGAWATVRFAGEIFELEDQRNWTDGSFKTYSTPLRLPIPARVEAGAPVRQSVTLSLEDRRPQTADRSAENERQATGDERTQPLAFSLLPSSLPLPPLGLGVASHGEALSEREAARLRALGPAHLRADLRLAEPEWRPALERVAAEARALGARLELALFLSDDGEGELRRLRAALDAPRPPIARWLVFHTAEKTTSATWLRLARARLAGYDAAAPFVGGTNAYFTDLNRARPEPHDLDGVAYSVNPQVHAFDNASLAECAATIAATVESARSFSGGRPIHLSPVTLRPRFNPGAAGSAPTPPGELPPSVDPRQMSLFGACWTLAALKYLAESGVASATLYETTGWRGVMEREGGSPGPRFPSLPGAVFPLFHLLADVGEFAGGEVVRSQSASPLAVEGLALRKGGAVRILLANMTNEPQRVRLELPFSRAAVRMLDERGALLAMTEPEAFRAAPPTAAQLENGALALDLLPYAVARLDAQPE